MVYLSEQLIKKGEDFEETYKTPKPVSRLSKKAIKEFLGSYGWVNDDSRYDFNGPTIASPIDKPKRGLEYKSGYTGDLRFFGMPMGDMGEHAAITRGAKFKDRRIHMDTYFNKVFCEAVKRGIITLHYDEDPLIFLSDLVSIQLNAISKRNSVQNREFGRKMRSLHRWMEASKDSMNDMVIGSGIVV